VPASFDLSDEDLNKYLPEVLADVRTVATYEHLEGGTYNIGAHAHLQDGRDVVVKISLPSTAPSLTYEAGLLLTRRIISAARGPWVSRCQRRWPSGPGSSPAASTWSCPSCPASHGGSSPRPRAPRDAQT
jgi:hypothetical protein